MIDNIRNNQIAQALGMNALPHPDTAGKPATGGSDATLRIDFADLIDQALAASETEQDAVRKAREMLQAGQLTTPQNIRAAAENIRTLGI